MKVLRAIPYLVVVAVSWWGVAGTHAPTPVAPVASATGVPVFAATTAARGSQPIEEGIVDTRSGTRVPVASVRDNGGIPWFTRNGQAVWTRASEGLVLVSLDGQVLDRVPGATDIRETANGDARAIRRGDDWFVTSPRGVRRLLGPLTFPSLSVDGRYFAFELVSGRVRAVYVVDLHSGEEIEVATGLGRCHCTAPDSYGYPQWETGGSAIAFRDHGDFLAQPEEAEPETVLLYDLSTRRLSRTVPATAAQAPRLPRCGGAGSIASPDGLYRLDYARTCALPRPVPPDSNLYP